MKAGDELRQHSVEITRDQITAYAEASGDRNPIHLDDDFAKSVGLPGVIAHGMLQMGLLASWVTELAGDHRKIRRLAVRFSGMVLPGDTLTFGGRVAEAVDGVLRLEVYGQNQRGDRVLTKGVAEIRAE